MEKNHKTAVMFLIYLKLILGTERVYSWKKKANRKSKKKTNQVKQRQHEQRKNDLISIYHIITFKWPPPTNQKNETSYSHKKHTLTQNCSLNTSELEDQKLKIIPGYIASSRPAYTIRDTFQTNLQANGIAIPE